MTRRWEVVQGDCLDVLDLFPGDVFDSVVTDPPYELTGARPGGRSEATRGKVMGGFMGMKWDATGVACDPATWAAVLRVVKPGAFLLAFGGARTYHRLACAIEDAGFEIRDQIMWMYGSGFPKSHNLSGERKGWGTALKPAHEPIVVARKPLTGTVAENALKYGTGALNIDECRVPTEENLNGGAYAKSATPRNQMWGAEAGNSWRRGGAGRYQQPEGRWPANVIHDGSEEVLAAFPDAPGQIADASSSSEGRKTQNVYGAMRRGRGGEPSADSDNEGVVGFKMKPGARRLDDGSAARFFYCAKASKKDRNDGCASLPLREGGMRSETSGQHITRRDGGAPGLVHNNHPTVKPTELMRYLCRLVTPSGGAILDPFCGSGSTGRGAIAEGFSFTGIEREEDYVSIAKARIAACR
jgi:site-specific DNA-methyltransferase (adenine-specific)